MTSNNNTNTEIDNECLQIINTKCYYTILKLESTATEEQIRKAYRKVIIKFHPDKNKSKHAENAFKKIAHAFNVLSNSEKRKFYDAYGPEEEVREKMYQQQENERRYYQQQYDETDPFELFNMFFGNTTQFEYRNGNLYRRNNHVNNQRRRQQNNQEITVDRYRIILYQLLPLILFMIIYIAPILFKTTPLWSFERDNEYFIKRSTPNKAEYYVNDSYFDKYKLDKMTIKEKNDLFYNIDSDYLKYLTSKCKYILDLKQDYQLKLAYYRGYPRYQRKFQEEINKLDYTYCTKMNNFSRIIK